MTSQLEQIARAMLYEGYALYPYRPSALKNQRRFAFGAIYPRAWAERTGEPSFLRVELVASGGIEARVAIVVRYLRLEAGGGGYEQTIELPARGLDAAATSLSVERDGVSLVVETSAVDAGDGLVRLSVEIHNVTELVHAPDRESVMDVVPASTHVVVELEGGTLYSAIDPPEHAIAATAACRSTGLYPVLVGAAVLASPIILSDQPEIAPESPGDFFDGTEMDEMLILRVLTLTDAERREAAAADPKIAALIERTARMGIAATAKLHGVVRTVWPREGSRVVLRPAHSRERQSDAFDVLLAGKRATVAKVERDLDGRVHCAVTLDDDPGADLGVAGMPGHRFFFSPDELEVIA